jgi:hypothetical protein
MGFGNPSARSASNHSYPDSSLFFSHHEFRQIRLPGPLEKRKQMTLDWHILLDVFPLRNSAQFHFGLSRQWSMK